MGREVSRVAHHEAGHGWMAHALGASKVRLTITPGLCVYSGIRQWDRRGQLVADAMVGLAGPVAERLWSGRPITGRGLSESDVAQTLLEQESSPAPNARRWLLGEFEAFCGDRAGYDVFCRTVGDLLTRTIRVLSANWPAVEHLAERLQHEREINI